MRDRRSPAPSLSARATKALLDLHTTVDFRSLCRAAERLVGELMPVHSVGAAMVLFEFKPLFFYSTRDGFHDVRGDVRYDPTCNPVFDYLRKNPGKKWVRLEDPLPPGVDIETTPFYKQVMEPEGWRYVIALNFWSGSQLLGWVSPVRSPAQGDFTAAEMSLLQHIYPHLEVCFQRLERIHQLGLTSAEIGSVMDSMQEPSAVLDWNLRVISCTDEAKVHFARWNHGEGGRTLNARLVFALPEAALAACDVLKEGYEESLRHIPAGAAAPYPDPIQVRHPEAARLRLSVRMIGSRGNGRGLPHFLLKCSETAESVSGKPLLLDLLTTREREIAREVWRGGSNECIALRLGRDIGTIKKQLTAVYRKLGIRTRTELVRALGELEKSGAPSLS